MLMVDTVLESKIRNIIEQTYSCVCTFPIKAKVVDDTYIIYLYVHGCEEHPIHMIWEGNSESYFFKWFQYELKERNLIRASYIKINLIHE